MKFSEEYISDYEIDNKEIWILLDIEGNWYETVVPRNKIPHITINSTDDEWFLVINAGLYADKNHMFWQIA